MAHVREIASYYTSRFADGRIYVGFVFTDGTSHTIHANSPADAAYMIDILRNEKPVYLDQYDTMYTGAEPIGEAE